VTGPAGRGDASVEETVRAARGGAGGALVVEVHRSARDAGGREMLGVARSVGGVGRAFVREQGPGGGAERIWERGAGAGGSAGFDREWADAAREVGLSAVPLGPSPDALRLLPQHMGGASPAREAPGLEEREAARRGRRVFEEHTRRLQEEARAARGPPEVSREGLPPPRRGAGAGRQPEEDLAFRLAREEAAGLWGRR